jgi:uncharacterized protein (UPF0297 family)
MAAAKKMAAEQIVGYLLEGRPRLSPRIAHMRL